MTHDAENKTCPSATCQEGSLLLGVVQADGEVAMLGIPLTVNSSFVETVRAEGHPEKRFRFANKCVKNGCKQWNGSSCSVAANLSQANPHLQTEEALRPCFIRDSCRWFHQEGKKACAICRFVVTDGR